MGTSLSFDDLIPKKKAQPPAVVSFDDLIPKPEAKKKQLDTESIAGFLRSLANSATGGMASKALGNVRGALGVAPDEQANVQAYDAQGKAIPHTWQSLDEHAQLQKANVDTEQAKAAAYADEHGTADKVAKGLGIVAGIKMLPAGAAEASLGLADKALQRLPDAISNTKWLARGIRSAPIATAFGGVSGAANAPSGDEASGALTGMATGAASAIPASLLADGLIGGAAVAGNTLSRVVPQPVKNAASGITQQVLNAMHARGSTPAMAPGYERLMNRLNKQGTTVDQYVQDLQAAPAKDMAAEVLGDKGISDLGAARTLGHTTANELAPELRARGMSELPDIRQAVTRSAGPARDEVQYANDQLAKARANSRSEYAAFEKMGTTTTTDPTPRLRSPEMYTAMNDLNGTSKALGIGKGIMAKVEAHAKYEGEMLPHGLFDANGQLQQFPTPKVADWIKKAYDEVLDYSGAATRGMQVPNDALTFSGIQKDLVEQSHRAFKDAIDHTSGGQYGRALAEFAGPMQERNAFGNALRDIHKTDPENVSRLVMGSNADAVSAAHAQAIHNALNDVNSGSMGGPIGNPANALGGTPNKDAVLRVALKDNPLDVENIMAMGRNASRRLGTNQRLGAGVTQTTEKAASAAEHLAEGATPQSTTKTFWQAITAPVQAATNAVGSALEAGHRLAVGKDMDAFGRLLRAGQYGPMSRDDLVQQLRTLTPQMRQRMIEHVMASGLVTPQVMHQAQAFLGNQP